MPALQNRGTQSRSEEQQEVALTGPFGGIQSELPATQIEALGFLDANNITFRKGTASPRPGLSTLPALPSLAKPGTVPPGPAALLGIDAHVDSGSGGSWTVTLGSAVPYAYAWWIGNEGGAFSVTSPGWTISPVVGGGNDYGRFVSGSSANFAFTSTGASPTYNGVLMIWQSNGSPPYRNNAWGGSVSFAPATLTTGTSSLPIGLDSVLYACVATDNTQNGSTPTAWDPAHSTITDTSGNTWVLIGQAQGIITAVGMAGTSMWICFNPVVGAHPALTITLKDNTGTLLTAGNMSVNCGEVQNLIQPSVLNNVEAVTQSAGNFTTVTETVTTTGTSDFGIYLRASDWTTVTAVDTPPAGYVSNPLITSGVNFYMATGTSPAGTVTGTSTMTFPGGDPTLAVAAAQLALINTSGTPVVTNVAAGPSGGIFGGTSFGGGTAVLHHAQWAFLCIIGSRSLFSYPTISDNHNNDWIPFPVPNFDQVGSDLNHHGSCIFLFVCPNPVGASDYTFTINASGGATIVSSGNSGVFEVSNLVGPPSTEPIMGIYQFYDINGDLVQGVMTPSRLLQFTGGVYVNIPGTGLHGTNTQLYSWDVLNYKLCFSQGADTLKIWDGITSSYSDSPGAPAIVKYVAEVGLHLIVVSPTFPMRYYWSGIGDPTDWTGFTSGLNDIVGNFGPINFVIKINQYGFGFHQLGITQIVPTGIGTNPFSFSSAANASIGTLAPFSVHHVDDQGREFSTHIGKDNVYAFDSSSVEPLGDAPLGDGTRRRLGARARIMGDLLLSNAVMVKGYCTYVVNGQPYRSYWINMPTIAMWVLNFDEGNWTRYTYTNQVTCIGPFTNFQSAIRIMDLVGTIAAQTWSPATLIQPLALDGILLGFVDGTTAYESFGIPCELTSTLTSGKLIFGDRRHSHTVKKFRLSFTDSGPVTFTLTISNEKGQTEAHSFTLGSGSGDTLNYVQEYKVPGLRLQYTLSVPANTFTGVVELAPMIDIGGEQRGGLIDN